jgi:hypothetical protein
LSFAAIAGELIAHMPEAKPGPRPKPPSAHERAGHLMERKPTMFELSPEDKALGEAKRAEDLVHEKATQRPARAPQHRGPRAAHDLSPEDKEKKPQ